MSDVKWVVAGCAKCGKPFGMPAGSVSHIIEDDGLHYHEACFEGDVPDSLRAWYAAEAQGKPKS